MLKKIAAVALLVGLALPYGCEFRPLTNSWENVASAIMYGIPVLVAIAYALHQLVPALARFHERNGPALHGVFRAVCLMLVGVYVGVAVGDDAESRDRIAVAVSFVVTAGLLYWQQGRGTKAQRLPLLLLTVVGVGEAFAFARYVGDGLAYGGWGFTAAWLVAVIAEVSGLQGAARVEHGG